MTIAFIILSLNASSTPFLKPALTPWLKAFIGALERAIKAISFSFDKCAVFVIIIPLKILHTYRIVLKNKKSSEMIHLESL